MCSAGDSLGPVPYGLNWPGTSTDPQKDVSLHADPIRFTSPVFQDDEGTLHNYDRVGFETNVNVFEANCDFRVTGNGCRRQERGIFADPHSIRRFAA